MCLLSKLADYVDEEVENYFGTGRKRKEADDAIRRLYRRVSSYDGIFEELETMSQNKIATIVRNLVKKDTNVSGLIL